MKDGKSASLCGRRANTRAMHWYEVERESPLKPCWGRCDCSWSQARPIWPPRGQIATDSRSQPTTSERSSKGIVLINQVYHQANQVDWQLRDSECHFRASVQYPRTMRNPGRREFGGIGCFGRMVALLRKGDDTTTRAGIETAGSGKDLGFWLWPRGAGRCKQHLTLAIGPHPSPAASPATVEEPRARTESRCASEERRAPVACVTVGHGHGGHGFGHFLGTKSPYRAP